VLGGRFAGDPDLEAVLAGSRELARGASGAGVKLLQQELYRAGMAVAGGFDGELGRGTEQAVAAFQRKVGLTPTGRVDRETLIKLQQAPETRALPPPEPLTASPQSFLRNAAEREAYDSIKQKLWTGWADWAVTNDEARAVLDKLDTLPPESYSRVLHALAATRTDDGRMPTLLDKLIRRGTSQAFNVRLSDRFCQQLTDKLGNWPEPDRRILSHVSPDSVDQLKGWAQWAALVNLFT
jgi:hypothetical protein